jgi:hypothetical protein
LNLCEMQVRREGLLKDVHDHMSIVLVILPRVLTFTTIRNPLTTHLIVQDVKDLEPEIDAIMAVSLEVLHSITVLRSLYSPPPLTTIPLLCIKRLSCAGTAERTPAPACCKTMWRR